VSIENPKAFPSKPIPAEGEGGLFRVGWYPICLTTELPPETVIGRDFLDGRVIAFRGNDGLAHVMSAFCPHVGADLSVGKVVDDHVQCAFHHWQYDGTGHCVKTGIGDPPPKSAQLYKFETRERWGIVWAWNGEKPLYDLPDLGRPDDELLIESYKWPEPFTSDPWVFAANTPDMQHLKAVHGLKFTVDDPHDIVEWDQYGLKYRISGVHQGGVELDWTLGLRGTSFFYRYGMYDRFFCAAITGFGLPRPGHNQVFGAFMVEKKPGAEQELARMKALSMRTIGEDAPLLNTIHYRQGLFTAGDRTLAKYLMMVRNFPRAHPSAPFIR
jgi:phenylpropionate dioxygenase-like ring-hydroxylating dioxygenase large terminal subunit